MTAVVLQARMGSTRLPGKVLLPLAGKPMLERIAERLAMGRRWSRVIVATSTASADDTVAAWAEARDLPLFRGSEEDVLDRYYQCALRFGLKNIVRATADNPFVDPFEGDRLIDHYERASLDYACAFPEFGGGLPRGVGLEVFSFAALERSWKEGLAPHHREHVNEFVQENPALFRSGTPDTPMAKRAPHLSLTVDLPEDFARAEDLYVRFLRDHEGEYLPVEWAIGQQS